MTTNTISPPHPAVDETVAPAVALAAEVKAARERAMTDPASPPPTDKPLGAPALDRKLAAGFAVGIGSAALVAALLYANRGKKAPGK